MKISFKNKGEFKQTYDFLNKAKNFKINDILSKYGNEGVSLLSKATPIDSGLTANSWTYEIQNKGNRTTLSWCNTNIQNGVNIAIILQYGHGTGTGGWVSGRDYINPTIRPLFDKMADQIWKEITNGTKY